MDGRVHPERWERESGSRKGVGGKGNVWQVIVRLYLSPHIFIVVVGKGLLLSATQAEFTHITEMTVGYSCFCNVLH